MERFYWLIEDAIAGCCRPGGTDRRSAGRFGGESDALLEKLDEDLAWLKQQGIGAVLSLTETPLSEDALARHGLEGLHEPVDDFHAPTPAQLMRALEFIDWQRAQNRGVAVHCLMGQGRTGTVLAAYLIRAGSSAEAAIQQLRAICPGAIGSQVQERALEDFARSRDWIA
ncbi:MAG TPA: dual specificity protein phosphatase family protein [Ktedonobacterales bacterium]